MLALKRLCSVLPKTASASRIFFGMCNTVAFGRTISWTGAAAQNTFVDDIIIHE